MLFRLTSKIRSALRLAKGSVHMAVGRASQAPVLISVDVFATILGRTANEDAAWRAGTLACAHVARQLSLQVEQDLFRLRQSIERGLASQLQAEGRCPEFSYHPVFEKLLRELGAGECAPQHASELADLQLEYEAHLTRPIAPMLQWIATQAAQGRRVIAVSDTRYSSAQVRTLLARHEVVGINKVYASADYEANKFSGKLFDIVLKEEGIAPSKVLHTGDSLLPDCFAAAERGIGVRKTRRPPLARCASPLPEPPPKSSSGDAFAVGYATVGPILVAFTRLLLEKAERDGVETLAFIARDGDLLLQVARAIVAERVGWNPELRYLQLSRRAVACAMRDVARAAETPSSVEALLREASDLGGGGNQLERVCKLFGLPLQLLSSHAARLGIPSLGFKASDLRVLLSDSETAAAIREHVAMQQRILIRYLEQENVFSSHTALVDVGWRGSIQRSLIELPHASGTAMPRGYYLGLWDESRIVSPTGVADGILCDQRRSRTLLESAARHAACLIESVCRADHGMVIGFHEESDGTVRPIHASEGTTRQAEVASDHAREQVREGVLAYARWFASEAACAPPLQQTRREAQKRLFRLAFFPSPQERVVGRLLVHTEPISDDWFAPLIMRTGQGLRGWLAGVRSPWKGGYFRETGGLALATLYCLAEDMFIWLPPDAKPRLRRLLIREAE